MAELHIRVDDPGGGKRFFDDLAERDLLARLGDATVDDRVALLRDDYGIEVSPWLLESLPTQDAVRSLHAQVRAYDYEQVVAGPERVHVVFCLLFPFPLPFFQLRGDEDD